MKAEKNILVLYKNNGKFYNAIGLDAYILSYIFGYKVLKGDRCGFPDISIENVTKKLDSSAISYQIVYSNRNPFIMDFGNKNKYKSYALNAKKSCEYKKRIDDIIYRLENCERKKLDLLLDRIEAIIN